MVWTDDEPFLGFFWLLMCGKLLEVTTPIWSCLKEVDVSGEFVANYSLAPPPKNTHKNNYAMEHIELLKAHVIN